MIFLNSIISEVNKPISEIFHIKLLARSPNISILVPIALETAIDTGQEDISPNVELSFLIQEGQDILLKDMGPGLSFFVLYILIQDEIDLFQSLYNFDSISTVGVFAGLHKPGVTTFGLETVFYLCVRVVLLAFLLLFYLLVTLLILCQKVLELFVTFLFYVKCHWNVLEWALVL